MQIFGYCHIHSKYSDGDLDLKDIKKIFLDLGASFIFITEHANNFNREKAAVFINECQRQSDKDFLVIPGLEVPVGRNHILVLGAYNLYEDSDVASLLKKYKSDKCLLIWAHPQRGNFKLDDAILNLLDGVEIWNSVYDTKYAPRYSSLSYVKNNPQNNWLLLSGLDFHRTSHLPGPKIFLSINRLDVQEILAKIKTGEYQIGNQKKLNRLDFIGKNYYCYFYLSIFFLVILKIFKTINSGLLALNIRIPVKIKNYLRKYI